MNTKKMEAKNISEYLTAEEISEVIREKPYYFIGEDDDLIMIEAHTRMGSDCIIEAVCNYFSAIKEIDNEARPNKAVLRQIIYGQWEEVQLAWDKRDGEKRWMVVREDDAKYDDSKPTFLAYIVESKLGE